MGLFIDNPRPVEKNLAIVILILNIIPWPGIGTIIYNIKTGDDKWLNVVGRVLLGYVFLLGMVWAIIDAVKILGASTDDRPSAA